MTATEHGAKAVRDRVAALLAADMPHRITTMCTLWSIDASVFPPPDMVTSGEAADFLLDARGRVWIEVITPRLMPRTQTVGLSANGNMVYRFRYSAKIYIWAIDDHWQGAIDQRDRLTAAARDSLLDFPTLIPPPGGGDSGYCVFPDTLTEEFGEPFRLGSKQPGGSNPRVRAAGLLNYEIVEEYEVGVPTTRPIPGPYTGYSLVVTLLPFTHPIGG